jgi:hypothetical protein
MENQNNNLFMNEVSMEELEPRLELVAAASKQSASVSGSANSAGVYEVKATYTVSF